MPLRLRSPLAAVLAALAALAATETAAAGPREGLRLVEGPRGRPALAGRSVSRAPGEIHAQRGWRTWGGRGATTRRDTTYGNGRIDNQVRRTWAGGAEAVRTGSVVRNPDGSVSVNRSRTGPGGETQSGWSTIYRTEDGYARDRGFATSNGRSASAHGEVRVTDEAVTVTRSGVTASGAAYSRSATLPRGE